MDKIALDTREAARLLGRSPNALYLLVARHRVPARRLGRRLVFLREELDRYLRSLPRAGCERAGTARPRRP